MTAGRGRVRGQRRGLPNRTGTAGCNTLYDKWEGLPSRSRTAAVALRGAKALVGTAERSACPFRRSPAPPAVVPFRALGPQAY